MPKGVYPRSTAVRDALVLAMKRELLNFKQGQKFYTKRACMRRYNASQRTVELALHELVRQGYFRPVASVGYFVRRNK